MAVCFRPKFSQRWVLAFWKTLTMMDERHRALWRMELLAAKDLLNAQLFECSISLW